MQKEMAADFEIFGVSNKELADYINEHLEYDQLILEYWKESDPNSGWVARAVMNPETLVKTETRYLKAYKDENNKTCYKPMLGGHNDYLSVWNLIKSIHTKMGSVTFFNRYQGTGFIM